MRSYLAKTTLSVLLVTLAFAFTSGCGEDDMGFKAGRFGDCGDLGVIANDQWIEDDQEMRLAGNCAWDYSASAARLIGAGVAKSCDDSAAMGKTWRIVGRMASKIVEIPLSQVAYGASRMIRFHVLLERDAAETIHVQATVVGGGNARVTLSGAPTGKELVTLTVDVPEQRSSSFENSLSLSLYLFGAGGGLVNVTVHSIGIFEPQHLPLVPAVFRDTTGANNTIGKDDWPVSTAIRDLMRDQQDVLHWARSAKPNIMSQCYVSGRLSSFTSYSTDLDRLGRWFVRKPYGGTSISFIASASIASGTVELKASLWSLAKIAYDTETSGFTAGDILEDYTSGARARIVKAVDNGATGYLWLAYIDGTFSNNDWLRGRNSATGALRGNALQNGAMLAGDIVDSDTATITGSSSSYEYFDLDTVDEDAEFEIRFDAEKVSGTAVTVDSFMVAAHVVDGSAIAHKLPRASWHEQDDPIRAGAYLSIKNTQNAAWHNHRAVILSDFRSWAHDKKPAGRYTSLYFNDSQENLAAGLVYLAPGTRAITASVLVSKPDLTFYRKLPVTSASGEWIEGEILTGATSGAWARIVFGQAGLASCYVRDESGTFASGETVSTPTGYAAITTGPSQRFSGTQKIRFAVGHSEDTPIASIERDVSLLGRGDAKRLDLSVNLDTNQFDNDSSVVGDYPLIWTLYASTTEHGDAVTLEQYQVFQAPSTTLDAELYEDQQ